MRGGLLTRFDRRTLMGTAIKLGAAVVAVPAAIVGLDASAADAYTCLPGSRIQINVICTQTCAGLCNINASYCYYDPASNEGYFLCQCVDFAGCNAVRAVCSCSKTNGYCCCVAC